MGPSGEAAAAKHDALALQVDAFPMMAMPTAASAAAVTAMSSSAYKAFDDEQHHHSSSHAASSHEPDTIIYFRKIVADDIEQVRELHETWFPIRYNQVRP